MKENDSCPNLSYQIGILKLAIGLHEQSLEHFNTAIRKVDDEDARYYLWKGIALCMGNNYDEALIEFRNAVHNDPTSLECGLYKGRCYLHAKELDRAINTFSNILDESPEGQHEIKFYIGNFFFHHMAYPHARTSYEEALKLKMTEKTLRELTKVYIVEKLLFKALEELEILCQDYPSDRYLFDINILFALKAGHKADFEEARDILLAVQKTQNTGFIFKQVDLVFYLGVIFMYLQDYDSALARFHEAKLLKYPALQPTEFEKEQEHLLLNSLFEEPNEEDDVPMSQTFTWLELQYNIALVHIMKGEFGKAAQLLEPLLEFEYSKDEAELLLTSIVQLMEQDELQFTSSSGRTPKLDLSEGKSDIKSKLTSNSNRLGQEGTLELKIFPYQNRLCGIYESISLTLASGMKLQFRLSFCLPSVELPSTEIKVGVEILDSLSILSVENRPEAPWIRRNHEGIVFTNNIIQTEATEVGNEDELMRKINSVTKGDNIATKIKLHAKKIFQEQAQLKQETKEERLQQLKEKLKLDRDIEGKLERITKQKQ